ncbi:MAG TPA: DUF1846 family protein [Candidatus Absconditabacterales bacterium]|nr:DUF1846 family protein [Candidatus Absconditabacterales bacterium]
MKSTDTMDYKVAGFDAKKYFELQKGAIEERISHFNGRLYLEIGGKFMRDSHASRVLPGFDPHAKKNIFESLRDVAEMIFCVNYEDILSNRQLSNSDINYGEYALQMILEVQKNIGFTPFVVINKSVRDDTEHNQKKIDHFIGLMKSIGLQVFKRYKMAGYPDNTEIILSNDGFGKDDYIPVSKNLVLVSGAASNSGKMGVCLGQMYRDFHKGFNSGYAKYETFPIWNLPVEHPINLAYEAATVDIGDYNCLDTYHLKAYNEQSVNYNRDVEAFELLKKISDAFVASDNFVRTYQSPTDMGINRAGFAVTNDEICSIASLREILRRKERYQEIISRGDGDKAWLDACDKIYAKALDYCKSKGYDVSQVL